MLYSFGSLSVYYILPFTSYKGRSVMLLELTEFTAVNNASNHIFNIERLLQIITNNTTQLYAVGKNDQLKRK